ncbi:MAG TPA: peptidase C39 family protein, partial [candidate division Zixibacteria bacterium]|nr:peptidase C39 family protein [candidate division Zixibacteria bacterium]
AYMLWRKGAPVGRLYNIAVDPDMRGRGLGQRLLDACRQEAEWRNCTTLSLEVRVDNAGAIALYRRNHFEAVGRLPKYYEDGADGVRMTRPLTAGRPERLRLKVPYYAQTLTFTCGPAALIMAMKYHRPDLEDDRLLEVTLWREATMIFMTSGMGGTGPFGMAHAVVDRGFSARVLLSKNQTPFFSSVRTADKRRVIKLVHEDLRERAYHRGIPVSYYDFSFDDIAVEMLRGKIPIVLISTYQLHGDRAPHWVVVTGFDREFVYVHDPYEAEYGGDPHRARNLKIDLPLFSRMRRYGRDLYKSVLFVGPGEA